MLNCMLKSFFQKINTEIPFPYWKLAGHVFFLVLATMSWFLYKERMLCFDTSFFAFKIIHFKEYNIELGRLCDVFSQAIPLYFLKQGCSLELFLKLYSISFIFVYYAIFLLLAYLLKNTQATLILLISLCICTRHVFYYPVSELSYGLALVPVLGVLLGYFFIEEARKLKKLSYLFLFVLVILLISYFHPIVLFAVPFVAGTEYIRQKKYNNPYFIAAGGLFFSWFILRFYVLDKTGYEQNKIITFSDFIRYLGELKTLPSTKFFIIFFSENLKSAVALLVVSTGIALYQKKYTSVAWWLINLAGFTALILVSYRYGESPVMYENYYLIIGLFITIILISVADKYISKVWFFILLIAFISFNTHEIFKAKSIFQKHIQYLDRLADYSIENKKNKLLIHTACYPWQYTWVDWALPFESLLNSSLKDPENPMTAILVDSLSQYKNENTNNNVFLGPRWAPLWFTTQSLDKNYFNLSKGLYTSLNSTQTDAIVKDTTGWNRSTITFSSSKKQYISDADNFLVIPITIENISGRQIPSLRKSTFEINFSYHLYDSNNKLLQWDCVRTFMEMDIDKKGTAGVIINLPQKKGDYFADIDLVTENQRWWGINYRVSILKK